MWKVGILGVTAAFMALLIKRDRSELALSISIIAGGIIFMLAMKQLDVAVNFIKKIVNNLPVDNIYFKQLLKMLGIAYIAEFCSNLCRESGYHAIAGQIELFGKIAIITVSIPILTYLVEVMGNFI